MAGKTVQGQVLEPFISEEQRALLPDVSGNVINGLGETLLRRPTPLYWHNAKTIAHGKVQTWMLQKSSSEVPEISDMNNQLGGRGSKTRMPKASQPVTDTPPHWTAKVKEMALANEADLVGIARLRAEWVFEGYEVSLPWIVMIGVQMEYQELAKAPQPPSVIEVMRQYNRGIRAARAVGDWILTQGYAADPHGGPICGPITMSPPAIACGFGELGKHGSIINRSYGASFRLACVLTDLPLVEDTPDVFGVDDFCTRCRLCTAACPPDAILDEKQMVRGEEKWYVDFDKCVPYFNETYGCGICLVVCPWSRPGVTPRLVEKMAQLQSTTSVYEHQKRRA